MRHDAKPAYAVSSDKEVRPSIVEITEGIELQDVGSLRYYASRDMANRLIELIFTSEVESRPFALRINAMIRTQMLGKSVRYIDH
jgi:hypothetical protein